MTRATPSEPLDAAMATREELLNVALDIVMDWGPELSRPQDTRLLERTRNLDPAVVPELLREANDATSIANGILYEGWGDDSHSAELSAQATAEVMAKYPWIDDDNVSHVISQACYYAWHG